MIKDYLYLCPVDEMLRDSIHITQDREDSLPEAEHAWTID